MDRAGAWMPRPVTRFTGCVRAFWGSLHSAISRLTLTRRHGWLTGVHRTEPKASGTSLASHNRKLVERFFPAIRVRLETAVTTKYPAQWFGNGRDQKNLYGRSLTTRRPTWALANIGSLLSAEHFGAMRNGATFIEEGMV